MKSMSNTPEGFFPLGSSPFEQNDANELFQLLVDRLETAMKCADAMFRPVPTKKEDNEENQSFNESGQPSCYTEMEGRKDANKERKRNRDGSMASLSMRRTERYPSSNSPFDRFLLQRVFSGKLAHQLICRDCPHRSCREELFYNVQLVVRGKRGVEESLEALVDDEMLEGDNAYFCEKCSKKVDTTKRCCFVSSAMPDTLVLHLKRFELNYDTFQKEKVNDHFSFPLTLDMAPYTVEGVAQKRGEASRVSVQEQKAMATPSICRPEDSIEEKEKSNASPITEAGDVKSKRSSKENLRYSLVGIIVHSGTANSGHYYSFIKERSRDVRGHMKEQFMNLNTDGNRSDPTASWSRRSRTGYEKPNDTTDGLWFEFNDDMVTPFDPEKIEFECFGGS